MVDVVRQGIDTSNTGNISRDFFAKADNVSKITGSDKTFLNILHNILQVVSCGKVTNFNKFKICSEETAKLCIDLYPWYKIPPSVHKILIHGSTVAKEFELPLGWYSEENQEANNKIFRKARANNSRVINRVQTNEDIIYQLLILSAPYIASLRIKEKKKEKELWIEAKEILILCQ